MNLSEILNLKRNSLVSIVGSGGKTTLMYLLANELKSNNKVLVSTTTKIYVPKKEEVDFIATGKAEYNHIKELNYNGIYAYGTCINDENKLIGISKEDLKICINDFSYILVEADGSKKKSIKGWNETEPVIYDKTDVTIGIMSFESLGTIINDENVHRVAEFNKLTDSYLGETIGIKHFIRVIFGENGLFKNSKGEKVLFLNRIEEGVDTDILKDLLDEIKKNNNKYKLLDKIIFGSLKNELYRYIEF